MASGADLSAGIQSPVPRRDWWEGADKHASFCISSRQAERFGWHSWLTRVPAPVMIFFITKNKTFPWELPADSAMPQVPSAAPWTSPPSPPSCQASAGSERPSPHGSGSTPKSELPFSTTDPSTPHPRQHLQGGRAAALQL